MILLIKYILPLFLFFSISCNLIAQKKENSIIFDKFNSEKKINLKSSNGFENLNAEGLALYHDSILIVRNGANTSKYHFSIFNLKSQKFLANAFEIGRKENQSLAFLSYGINADKIWVYDIIKEKVLTLNLDSLLNYNTININEFSNPNFYYSTQLIDPITLLGSGDYDSDYWLAYVNLNNGDVIEQLIPYAQDTLSNFKRSEKMAYESFLFLKPSKDKCALAARYSDRVQIVDLKSKESIIIKGPNNLEPKVLVMKGNDGKELSTRNHETIINFVKGQVTDKYIYLLYSGDNDNGIKSFNGKAIYVYDWNGNPVRKLILNDYVLDFVVTSDDKNLYGYNPKTKTINTVSLN